MLRKCVLYVWLCLFGIFLSGAQAAHAADNPLYTIDNVKVDVTDKDAIAAQSKAFTQAQEQAFQQLTQRLLSPDALTRFKTPDDQTLSTLIRDYEITAEQRSNVRYIGTYSIRFKSDAVRSYIATQSLSMSENYVAPTLLLPFYQQGDQTILWGDANIWRAAWLQLAPAGSGSPVLPFGDAADIAAVENSEALTYTVDHLQILEKRYRTNDAAVAILSLAKADASSTDDKDQVDSDDENNNTDAGTGDITIATILLYRTDRMPPSLVRRLVIPGQPGEDDNALLLRAAQKVKAVMQHNWKAKTPPPTLLTDAAPANNATASSVAPMDASAPVVSPNQHDFIVTAHFAGFQEWIMMQKSLRHVSGINQLQILSLQSTMAQLKLSYEGPAENLHRALHDIHLTLTQNSASPSYSEAGDKISSGYDLYRNDDAPSNGGSGNE